MNSIQQLINNIANGPNSALAFKPRKELLKKAQEKDTEALFQLGQHAFTERRFGFAERFFVEALKNGCLEASRYLAKIDLMVFDVSSQLSLE